VKRAKFLRAIICNQPFLEGFLSRDALANPSPMIKPFAQRNEIGYFVNINCVIEADTISQRRVKIPCALVLGAILVGSCFLGVPHLVINIVAFVLTSFAPISQSVQTNDLQYVLALALIEKCLLQRRGRRRRRVSSPTPLLHTWNLVTLRVHALLISYVVATLRFPSICLTSIGAYSRARKKSATRPDGCTGARIARGGPDGSAKASSQERPTYSSCRRVLIDRLLRCQANLLARPQPAARVLGLKYLEGLSRGGKHHHTWACRDSRASSQDQQHHKQEKASRVIHRTALLLTRWSRRRNNLHPAVRTLFDVRVVAFRVLAVIPIVRFLGLRRRLDIHRRRLLNDDGRRRIVRIRKNAPIDGTTPPRPPSRSDPDASSIVWPPPVPAAITIPASITIPAMITMPAVKPTPG
jgi:hypothetical protein